jgi:hypothetical protein
MYHESFHFLTTLTPYKYVKLISLSIDTSLKTISKQKTKGQEEPINQSKIISEMQQTKIFSK